MDYLKVDINKKNWRGHLQNVSNKTILNFWSIKEAINKLNDKFFLSNGDTIFDINLFDFQKNLKRSLLEFLHVQIYKKFQKDIQCLI